MFFIFNLLDLLVNYLYFFFSSRRRHTRSLRDWSSDVCSSDLPSYWAISFSWCGKIRSSPPPWTSKPGPRYFDDITEHSRCHPGRPSPQGERHQGSPGLALFHSTKSSGSRLSGLTSTLAPACRSARSRPDNLPYSGNLPTEKYTSPPAW